MRITIILAILVFSLSLFNPCFVLADDSTPSGGLMTEELGSLDDAGAVEVGESLLTPSSRLYFLKVIREKIENVIASSKESKTVTQIEFSLRRLREVKSLIKNQRQDLIPPVLEKYKLNLSDAIKGAGEDEQLKIKIGEAISRHLDVLQRVYDQVGNTRAKQAILSSIERSESHNRELLQRLSLINQQVLIRKIALRQAHACQFIAREATSSALNETEKSELRERVRQCSQSIRENLRDELMEIRQKRMGPTAESTSSAETANWKTYTNTLRGYSLKFPQGWETYLLNAYDGISKLPDQLEDELEIETYRKFQSKSIPVSEISLIIDHIKKASYSDFEKSLIKSGENRVKSIKIDGVLAVKADKISGEKYTQVLFQKGNYIYQFSATQKDEVMLDQILSTFKFLP